MTRLPPSRFGFSNYDGGCIPTSVFLSSSPDAIQHFLEGATIIGWTDELTAFRPRPDCCAIMFEQDGGEYWCHLLETFWQRFLDSQQQKP